MRYHWVNDVEGGQRAMTLTVGSGPWRLRAGDRMIEEAAISHPEPPESAPRLEDYIALRVEIEVDGEIEPQVETPWSAPDWWKGIREQEAQL
jgi:hypothetical protein